MELGGMNGECSISVIQMTGTNNDDCTVFVCSQKKRTGTLLYNVHTETHRYSIGKVVCSVAGVLDEPYSQLSPLSGVAVQARQSK
jgi:hypothetical protein